MSEENKLPTGWKELTISEIGKVKGGKRLPKGHNYSENKTQFPYIRVTDFENLTIRREKLKYLLPQTQAIIKNYTISKHDVFISIAGTIGEVGLIPEILDGANLTENAAKITQLVGINNRYLANYLSSKNAQTQIAKHTISTTQPKLSLFRIDKIIVPIPPLPEQLRIVSKIEELFSDLDKGIESLKTAKQQLKIYRQAVLKWAFEGRLTNENIKEGELPNGWKHTSIEDVANVSTGVTPLRSNVSFWKDGTIPWITSGALNDLFVFKAEEFITDKAFKETSLKILPKYSLLIALYGEGKTRGKCSELMFESTTNQAIAGINLKEEYRNIRKYLKWFLLKNYYDVRLLSSGGVQPNLNLSIIKKTKFPFPPIKEQEIIVKEIDSRLSVCDKIEEMIREGNDN